MIVPFLSDLFEDQCLCLSVTFQCEIQPVEKFAPVIDGAQINLFPRTFFCSWYERNVW